MADDPLLPPLSPRLSGAEQWQQAIAQQQQRDLTKPSTGEQIGDIINRMIAANPVMQAGNLYQQLQSGLDPLSPEAAGRGLWTALSMAGAGMPYAERGAVGAVGGKPGSLSGLTRAMQVPSRFVAPQARRMAVLDKLIANEDFNPIMHEGKLHFASLDAAENEEINRIGWARAPDITSEMESGPDKQMAWRQNIAYWRQLADVSDKR